MLIHEKLPQGHIYPQITQTPGTYGEFLDAFRGSHTIDDNLTAHTIAETLQAAMLKIAIASRHLKKTKGAASPNESLADIFLTKGRTAPLCRSDCRERREDFSYRILW
jgi:hypothetical protein